MLFDLCYLSSVPHLTRVLCISNGRWRCLRQVVTFNTRSFCNTRHYFIFDFSWLQWLLEHCCSSGKARSQTWLKTFGTVNRFCYSNSSLDSLRRQVQNNWSTYVLFLLEYRCLRLSLRYSRMVEYQHLYGTSCSAALTVLYYGYIYYRIFTGVIF